MKRILGLDASSAVTGWAILDEEGNLINFGEIKLEKFKTKKKPIEYLEVLYESVAIIMQGYRITDVFMEDIFARNILTYKTLGRVRGVCELAALHSGINKVTSWNPTQIRSKVLGKGGLKSEQICPILEERYGQPIATPGFDASDAILVAMCGVKECHQQSQPRLPTKRNLKRRSCAQEKPTTK